MLHWTTIITLCVLGVALLGFGGVAAANAGTAQVLFYMIVVGCVVAVDIYLAREVEKKT
ncbi:MAG: DUF1328 domain-containing protein [Halobacteriovoraceae bacterium]|nr:DUF1328 domain-containing protein [Halobacteriovoraceae bacterium]